MNQSYIKITIKNPIQAVKGTVNKGIEVLVIITFNPINHELNEKLLMKQSQRLHKHVILTEDFNSNYEYMGNSSKVRRGNKVYKSIQKHQRDLHKNNRYFKIDS